MTRHLRTARAFLGGAGGCVVLGLYATTISPWIGAPILYGAVVCAWCARSYYSRHRRTLAEAAWEKAYVLGQRPGPLNPCCMLADHSGGEAHDRKCTDLVHRPTANPRSTA